MSIQLKPCFAADELDAAIEELRANTGPCVCDEDDCPRLSHNVYRGFQPAIALVDRMYMTTLKWVVQVLV